MPRMGLLCQPALKKVDESTLSMICTQFTLLGHRSCYERSNLEPLCKTEVYCVIRYIFHMLTFSETRPIHFKVINLRKRWGFCFCGRRRPETCTALIARQVSGRIKSYGFREQRTKKYMVNTKTLSLCFGQVTYQFTERLGRVVSTPEWHSGNPRFKSKSGGRLSRLRSFEIFSSPSRQMLG